MIWYTSDLHLWHKNIITYCNRPFRTADGQPDMRAMVETLLRLWNERVKPADHVRVVGDLTFGHFEQTQNWLAHAHGTKTLVLGNHDKRTKTWYRSVGIEPVDELIDGDYYIVHKPPLPLTIVEKGCKIALCGHVHEHWARRDNVINVGVDVRQFAPVTIEELLATP